VTDVLLVVTPEMDAMPISLEALRNFLGREPGLDVLVMRLDGSWTACKFHDVASWFQGVADHF
jgi:hypothetical protein